MRDQDLLEAADVTHRHDGAEGAGWIRCEREEELALVAGRARGPRRQVRHRHESEEPQAIQPFVELLGDDDHDTSVAVEIARLAEVFHQRRVDLLVERPGELLQVGVREGGGVPDVLDEDGSLPYVADDGGGSDEVGAGVSDQNVRDADIHRVADLRNGRGSEWTPRAQRPDGGDRDSTGSEEILLAISEARLGCPMPIEKIREPILMNRVGPADRPVTRGIGCDEVSGWRRSESANTEPDLRAHVLRCRLHADQVLLVRG